MKYYCYVKDCYVGIREFTRDNITMEWVEDSELSDVGLKYKKYLDLSTKENILAFIGERVPDPRRPNVSPFLSSIGNKEYVSR